MNEKMSSNDLEQFEAEAVQLLGQETVDQADYLEMCRKAAALRANQPELGEELAYQMVSLGSRVQEEDERIRNIKDLYYDLDIPEGHVDTSGGLSVNDRWNEIARLSHETEAQ